MADFKFPHIQDSITNFLYDEEGNIPRNKVLTIGAMMIVLGCRMRRLQGTVLTPLTVRIPVIAAIHQAAAVTLLISHMHHILPVLPVVPAILPVPWRRLHRTAIMQTM